MHIESAVKILRDFKTHLRALGKLTSFLYKIIGGLKKYFSLAKLIETLFGLWNKPVPSEFLQH